MRVTFPPTDKVTGDRSVSVTVVTNHQMPHFTAPFKQVTCTYTHLLHSHNFPSSCKLPGAPQRDLIEWPVPLLPAAGLLMIVPPLYELCFLYQYTSISQNSRVCLTEIDFFSFLFMFLLLPLSTRIMSTIR